MIRLIVMMVMFPVVLIGQELPERNRKIIDYVDSVAGKRVKKGICRELCIGAINLHGDKSKILIKEKASYGKVISLSDAMPGDIIQFRGVIIGEGADSKYAGKHVGIIYNIYPDGTMDVAEQNVNTPRKNLFGVMVDSKVVLSDYDLSKITKGRVKVYRVI
jgi:hypothetical protein